MISFKGLKWELFEARWISLLESSYEVFVISDNPVLN